MLWQWGRFYRSIYDMSSTDRPSDDVIADDAKLDQWFRWYEADVARRVGRSRGAGSKVKDWERQIFQFGDAADAPEAAR